MSNTEDTSLAALRDLRSTIGFTLHIIEASDVTARPAHDAPFWRKHDLIEAFPRTSWRERLVAAFLRWFQWNGKGSACLRVLISPGGKLDNYLDFVKQHQTASAPEFALPIVKKDLKRLPYIFLSRHLYYYYFYSSPLCSDPRVVLVVEALRRNLKARVTWIDSEILFRLMERYIFAHFQRALSHYQTIKKWLVYLKPDLVFLSSETPLQHLLGLAAKASAIPTVLCNHCLSMWGSAKTKSGAFKIIDYAVAFGKKDRVDYQSVGMDEGRIFTAPLPYFGRFLPIAARKIRAYKKGLILLHQYAHFSPGAKVEQVRYGFLDPIEVLDTLGIEVVGIKIGYENNLQTLRLGGAYFDYRGRRIPILSGQSSFLEVASEVDLIIGSVSTSIVEAGLLGVDYFLYSPEAPDCTTPSLYPALTNIIRIARTKKELCKNIQDHQPYHEGYSVADLVDLSSFSSEAELCSNFSATLARVMERSLLKRSPTSL